MKKRRIVLVVAAACCLAVYGVHATRTTSPAIVSSSAQADEEAQSQEEAPEAAPAVVAVQDALGLTSLQARQYAGRVTAIEEVDIIPRVTGWIEKINFKEGDFVKEGDVLFEIEDVVYQSALETAEANLEQAKAVQLNAQTAYNRAKELFDRKAGSQADLDNATQTLAQANASVKICGAALVDAKTTLSYTKIAAPISGRIGKASINRGDLVSPQTGTIVDVRQFAPIHVKFAIGESVFNNTFGGDAQIRDLAKIKICPVGASRTDSKAIEDYPEATIDLIDNHVDPTTNTIVIWATLENADSRFFPGSYCTVMLSRKVPEPVPAVLQSAIQTAPEGNFVYVVKNGVAERRFVSLGPISDNYYVINEGVEIGETIVVEGMNKVADGGKVAPVPYASWETSSANGAPAAKATEAESDAASEDAQ